MPRLRGLWTAGLIGAVLSLGAAAGARLAAQGGQQPVFKSGVDLIAVDVSIVDKNGNPIPGVRPDQFDVTIDGKPRRVVSAEFIEFTSRDKPGQALPEPPLATRRLFSSNEQTAPTAAQGRLIYLAVDQGSFKPLAARGAMEAARRFIDRLQPADRVGFVAFPAPGPSVPATAHHEDARAATAQIVGRATPFRADGLDKNVSLGEALDIRAGDALTTQKVLARECSGLGGSKDPACELEVRNTARSIGTNAEIQAQRSLAGMEAVVRSLAQIRERKTLVLISAGLPVSDRAGMDLQLLPFMTSLGREAAAANLNFFVLHIDSGFLDAFSAEQRTISDTLDRDLSIMSGGLETIAGSSGGSLVRIVAGADFAFDRVQRETSAAYLLGVEPLEGDRDGKLHRISVKVRIPGAEVRNRREVMLTKAAVKPATGREILAAAFRSDQPETALPVRLATFSLAPDDSGAQRVLISADIGADSTGPADIWTAYATTDAAGRAQPGVAQEQRLRPRAAGPRGALSFTAQTVLPPGRHTLRFAAVDAAGRAGRVDHAFSVGLAKGDGILMSDLLVIEPLLGGEDRLDVVTDGIVRGDAVDAYIELVPTTQAEGADVTFGVAETPEDDPIVSARGLMTRVEGAAHWSATARLGLATLAPGDYVVTATVVAGEREIGRAVRAIHIEPPAR
jgi:VWFA-related protein